MELITTYPAAVNSKATVTMGALDQATTIVEVLDATVLPEAPNLLVLGTDQTAETVLMTARENNTLTIQRAVQGIAKSWPAGTQIARNFTGKDWDDMRSNVEAIVTKILGLTASDVGAFVDYNSYGSDYFGTNDTTQWNKSGCYSTSRDSTGLPNGCDGWGTMFIFSSSGSERITQIFFPWNGIGGKTILYYRIYSYSWSEWREINDTSKFLPLDGSVPMNGSIDFAAKGANFDTDSWFEIGMDNESISLLSRKNGKNRRLNLNNITSSLTDALRLWYYDDGNEHTARIFGEHNKPSGRYTGNGSATSRTIAINAIGKRVSITGSNGTMAELNEKGGYYKSGTTMVAFDVNTAYFSGVDIVLNTAIDALNANSITYTYQTL